MTSSRHTASRTATLVDRASRILRSSSSGIIRSGNPGNARPSKASGAGAQVNRSKAREAAASGEDGQTDEDMSYLAGTGTAECGARTPSAHVNPTATPRRLPRWRLLAQVSGLEHKTALNAKTAPARAGANNRAGQNAVGCCWVTDDLRPPHRCAGNRPQPVILPVFGVPAGSLRRLPYRTRLERRQTALRLRPGQDRAPGAGQGRGGADEDAADPRSAAGARRGVHFPAPRRRTAGYDAIAARLNTDPALYPVPEPTSPHRRRGVWSGSAVRDVLHNPKYTGYMVWNRRATKSGGRVNPPSAWVWSDEPTHEPLVDRETFQAGGARLPHPRGLPDRSRSELGAQGHKRGYLLRSAQSLTCRLCRTGLTDVHEHQAVKQTWSRQPRPA